MMVGSAGSATVMIAMIRAVQVAIMIYREAEMNTVV